MQVHTPEYRNMKIFSENLLSVNNICQCYINATSHAEHINQSLGEKHTESHIVGKSNL